MTDQDRTELYALLTQGFATIKENNDKIDVRLTHMEKNVIDISRDTHVMKNNMQRVLPLVDGNGVRPVLERLAVIEKEVQDIAAKQDKMEKNVWDILKPIILGALSAAGGAAAVSGVI